MWNMTYGDEANILQIGIGKMKIHGKLQYGIKNEHVYNGQTLYSKVHLHLKKSY